MTMTMASAISYVCQAFDFETAYKTAEYGKTRSAVSMTTEYTITYVEFIDGSCLVMDHAENTMTTLTKARHK